MRPPARWSCRTAPDEAPSPRARRRVLGEGVAGVAGEAWRRRAPARMWGPSLLVEELLELQGAPELARIGGIERRIRVALLQRLDDAGRIADPLTVQRQHRKRRPAASFANAQAVVHHGRRRAAHVRDLLVVERPAGLFVVVADLDVVEDRRGRDRTHLAAESHFADEDGIARQRDVIDTRRERRGNGEIATRLTQLRAANDIEEDVEL